MNRIQKVFGSVVIASVMAVAPLMASADTLNASSASRIGVFISPQGIVHVIGANVTSVGNEIVNAATTIGNTVLNWIVSISASTNISGTGSANATTTGIKVGDKVNFTGSIASSTGSTFSVIATKIRDLAKQPFRNVGNGEVTSVNAANGSFVVEQGNHSVIVQTNASTTISLGGATTTLASLKTGDKVWVSGTPNADGSAMIASTVIVRDHNAKKQEVHKNKEEDDDKWHGNATTSSNAGVSVSAEKEHGGLKIFGGLHIGVGKDD